MLLPRGCVSLSVGDLVLSVGNKQYEMLRYVCVMVEDVFKVSSSQVKKIIFKSCAMQCCCYIYKIILSLIVKYWQPHIRIPNDKLCFS